MTEPDRDDCPQVARLAAYAATHRSPEFADAIQHRRDTCRRCPRYEGSRVEATDCLGYKLVPLHTAGGCPMGKW